MALRSARPHITFVWLLALTLTFFPRQVQAEGGVQILALQEFISTVSNGEVDTLRGIYVPQVLASPIVPQPAGDASFVSGEQNTLTQFRMASEAGSIGLLAHNYLAGEDFFRIQEGHILYLVYGDGHTQAFMVTHVLRFHALDPDSLWSRFLDLQHGTLFSASELFSHIYGRPGNVVLQTCIRVGGEFSWGRLFIIAEPYSMQDAGTVFPSVRGAEAE